MNQIDGIPLIKYEKGKYPKKYIVPTSKGTEEWIFRKNRELGQLDWSSSVVVYREEIHLDGVRMA